MKPGKLLLLKFGGSLITDKNTPYTARFDVIHQLAKDFGQVFRAKQSMSFILGNGAGSFGHYAALHHDVRTLEGFRFVHGKVRELNALFREALEDEGVPVTVLTGADVLRLHDGKPVVVSIDTIWESFDSNTVPMVYGDVIPDEVRGGAIYSTEMLFECIVQQCIPQYSDIEILHLTTVAGFLDTSHNVIPKVTRKNIAELEKHFSATAGFDVTGGMRHKIEQSLQLADLGIRTRIVDGSIPGICQKIILAHEPLGTAIL